MEFDKSRVYTAVNAEELKIGSKCIFADAVGNLQDKVENNNEVSMELALIKPTDRPSRFEAENGNWYLLAYLIEPPAEPKYKPFSSMEKAMEAIKKHGEWVKERLKVGERQCLITVRNFGFEGADEIFLNGSWLSRYELFHGFVFADDGSPCGELVEE